MNVGDWLNRSAALLSKTSGTGRLDAEVLLSSVMKKNKAWILTHPDHQLSANKIKKLSTLLNRRLSHEPMAYIIGKCEFYGREFLVDKRVLVPRPESETMIDLLKHYISVRISKKLYVDDIGTGSGVLAITSKLELPDADVTAIDIDPKCLKVAKKNASRHKANIKILQGNLLEPTFDIQYPTTSNLIILANLPYVPDSHTINEAAMVEPKIAIFGGSDGLDLYRKLFEQLSKIDNQATTVFTESLPFQHQKLALIARKARFKLTNTDDFVQLFTRL